MSANDIEAEVIVTLTDGSKVDINNIPGKKKKELIKKGQIAAEKFVIAPNMPGKLLAQKRKEFLESLEREEQATPEFLKGEMVKHKGHVVEIADVDNENKKLMYKKGKKKIWVSFKNVKIIEEEKEDGEEKEEE